MMREATVMAVEQGHEKTVISGPETGAERWLACPATEHSMKTNWLLLVLIAVPRMTPAQVPKTSTKPQAVAATGAFFALSVSDVKASAQWYSEKLGMRVVMVEPKRDKSAVVVLEGDGLIVELIQNDDALPLSKAAPGTNGPLLFHGIFKAGVIVDDFDQALARLKTRNVEIAFGPFPARGNQRANVIVRDNSGNLIQFFGK